MPNDRESWQKALGPMAVALVLLVAPPGHAQEPPSSSRFAIAPYLLDVSSEAATVAFHLREPLQAALAVQTNDEVLRVESSEPRRAHFLQVTGLSPGRTYRYEVRCGDGAVRTPVDDPSYQIRTAARAGESFTFAVYGDPRPGESQSHRTHRMVVAQMLQAEPAFCLVLGDMVDDGSAPAQWEAFFRVEAELRQRSAIFPVLGDNDYAEGRGRAADYFPKAGRGPYHFAWGGLHFFGMSAWGSRGAQPESEIDADSEQLRWLADKLAEPEVRQAPFRVLFLHDPIYTSRGRSAVVLQRAWEPLIRRGGIDLVLASWHLYERSQHNGVTYIVSGGAGAELAPMTKNPAFASQVVARRHHYCRVDVGPGAMQIRAIAEDGTVLDAVTLQPRTGATDPADDPIQDLAERLEREQRHRDAQATRSSRTASPSLGKVLAAGLLDGLSPWALFAIAFVLSILSMAGGRRLEVLRTGGLVSLAVLLTSLALGALLYPRASALVHDRSVTTAAGLILGGVLLALAGRSALEAIHDFRGRHGETALEPPTSVHGQIRARVRALARNRRVADAAALLLGVVIACALLRSAGPIHLSIVNRIAAPRHRAEAAAHLLAHDLALVAPLFAALLLGAFGLSSPRIARLRRRHPAACKLARGLLFVGLALVVVYNLG